MRHNIPFARTDTGGTSTEKMVEWLKVDELLDGLRTLQPKDEFAFLLDFLVEYSGGLELARVNMMETLMHQAATKYNAYIISVQKIKARIFELYEE